MIITVYSNTNTQPTEKSALNRKYEDVIRKSECNVKVVESAGMNVRRKLQKSYPFKRSIQSGPKVNLHCVAWN